MKSALNGGLLVGTYDGATIEIIKAIGEENVFVFGHREEEIEAIVLDHAKTPPCPIGGDVGSQLCYATFENFGLLHNNVGNVLMYDGHAEGGRKKFHLFLYARMPQSTSYRISLAD